MPAEMANAPEEAEGHEAQGQAPREGPHGRLLLQRRPAGRYNDGNGLYLHVDPSGARRWVQRLVVQGRSRALGLGSYRLVSLAEARARALANGSWPARAATRRPSAGGAPRACRPSRRRRPGSSTSTAGRNGRAARRRASGVRASATTSSRTSATSVDRVTTADIMAALHPIWTGKHVTARKVHHRVSTVMRQHGHALKRPPLPRESRRNDEVPPTGPHRSDSGAPPPPPARTTEPTTSDLSEIGPV